MTKKNIDIDQIAKDVAEQVRKDFLDDLVEVSESKLIDDAVAASVSSLGEAYVPQNKSFAMTTDYLSEPSKKDHEALYRKEVSSLTRVSAELDGTNKIDVDSNHSGFRSVKKDEITLLNAVYLHELYFANCFDPNSELFLDSLTYTRIAADWGTFDAWMAEFEACALASRSGWVVCGYSMYLKKLINVFIDGHDSSVLCGLVPVIVIDMWEHAFQRDYGNDKKSYLTSMMRELDWDVIEDRITRVDALKKVMG